MMLKSRCRCSVKLMASSMHCGMNHVTIDEKHTLVLDVCGCVYILFVCFFPTVCLKFQV